jgi:hypothetical protein
MPRGVRGFRWVRTGGSVWQLEDTPRHFRGCVSLISGDVYSWHTKNGGPCGEAWSKADAMRAVERVVIDPARTAANAR